MHADTLAAAAYTSTRARASTYVHTHGQMRGDDKEPAFLVKQNSMLKIVLALLVIILVLGIAVCSTVLEVRVQRRGVVQARPFCFELTRLTVLRDQCKRACMCACVSMGCARFAGTHRRAS